MGTIRPADDSVLANEAVGTNATGQVVEALTPTGPILIGDYWQAGHVKVIDASTAPFTEALAIGQEDHDCAADVGVADVDGSGTPDIVAACLNAPLTQRGSLEVYARDAIGDWQVVAWLEGTAPNTWFGRPTVGGFDLGRDGVLEMAIGEEHIGEALESAVHVVSGPWRGHCTLEDLGAIRLWNGFPPANLLTADVDGDGVGELVSTRQGSPAFSFAEATVGWVSVIRGAASPEASSEDAGWLTFEGLLPEEGFGSGVAVGDFNADGCADVAVGAEGFELNADNPPGKVYVFDGPFTEGTVSAADADVILHGSSDWDWFGRKLVVGDYDGDGIDDLAVAAIRDSTIAREAGAIYVLLGAAGAR